MFPGYYPDDALRSVDDAFVCKVCKMSDMSPFEAEFRFV
jgi:hypothetical protein